MERYIKKFIHSKEDLPPKGIREYDTDQGTTLWQDYAWIGEGPSIKWYYAPVDQYESNANEQNERMRQWFMERTDADVPLYEQMKIVDQIINNTLPEIDKKRLKKQLMNFATYIYTDVFFLNKTKLIKEYLKHLK